MRFSADELARMSDAERKATWPDREPERIIAMCEELMERGHLRARHSCDVGTGYPLRVIGISARWTPWNWCAVYDVHVETEPQLCLDGKVRSLIVSYGIGTLTILDGHRRKEN